jgi:APA family basic amino acid/polyamine antiporter
VILAFFDGKTHVALAMARDGLLPRRLAKVSRAGVPVRTTLVTTLVVSTIASFLSLGDIVALANAGTPLAFSNVALVMLVMRRRGRR